MTGRGKFVGGMMVGAGAMYWLDRERSRTASRPRPSQAAPEPEVRGGYGARRGDIAGLEAAALETGGPAGAGPARSTTRALRALGAGLLVYSFFRRGRRWRIGRVARILGIRLLAQAQVRRWRSGAVRRAVPAGRERRRIVDIQKSLHVEAPVEQVYAFWSNYENFPLFVPSLRSVEDLGSGRSRWSLRGPEGVPVSWTARLTEERPNEVLAWRSEPGSLPEQAGVVRFRPEGTGTRIDVRFCYRPPAGRVGRAVTGLAGADPNTTLNDSLDRLRALLEATVESEHHGQESGA